MSSIKDQSDEVANGKVYTPDRNRNTGRKRRKTNLFEERFGASSYFGAKVHARGSFTEKYKTRGIFRMN